MDLRYGGCSAPPLRGALAWAQGVGASLPCPRGVPAPLGLNCCVTEQPLYFNPALAGDSGGVLRPNSIRCDPGTPSTVEQQLAQLCKLAFASQKKIILLLFFLLSFFSEGQVEGAVAMVET